MIIPLYGFNHYHNASNCEEDTEGFIGRDTIIDKLSAWLDAPKDTHDQEILNMFEDYRKIYEERENINLGAHFEVDKSALNVPRKLRKIKLDDTVELCLMKTGNFIERGFDENRGRSYYKIYFSKEK